MKKHNSPSQYWLYGIHPVSEALKNPLRIKHGIMLAKGNENAFPLAKGFKKEIVDKDKLGSLLGREAVHQGVAMLVDPLPGLDLDFAFDKGSVLILDQITDPHNIGAILRSAAAFAVGAVIMPDDNSPGESGVLAKSASGALDIVPIIRVTNLRRAMEELKENGFWCVGFDGDGKGMLNDFKFDGKTALVMGAEGDGMRRLTKESCDVILRIPMNKGVESLNVSNAAAIALYSLYTKG